MAMCPHGFIGACAECDGAGQIPEAEPATPQGNVLIPEALLRDLIEHLRVATDVLEPDSVADPEDPNTIWWTGAKVALARVEEIS